MEEPEDIKQIIRGMERGEPDNLYSKYRRVKVTKKEKNQSLDTLIHPDLLSNERVSLKKY